MIRAAIPPVTREPEEHRVYRPTLHKIHFDRKNNRHIIVLNSHVITETNKPIVLYTLVNGGCIYAVPLNVFNEVLEDGKLRFVVVNNYKDVFDEETLLTKAIDLLKEFEQQNSGNLEIKGKIEDLLKQLSGETSANND